VPKEPANRKGSKNTSADTTAFDQFQQLTRKLVGVRKSEIDAARAEKKKASRPSR
jgi:hypothetical protein